MRRKVVLGVSFLVAVLMASGCATLERDAYRTLSVAASAYESGMAAFAEAYAKGLVSDQDKERCLRVATAFWTAYHEAVIALEIYKVTATAPNKERLVTALGAVSQRWTELLHFLTPYLPAGGKTP